MRKLMAVMALAASACGGPDEPQHAFQAAQEHAAAPYYGACTCKVPSTAGSPDVLTVMIDCVDTQKWSPEHSAELACAKWTGLACTQCACEGR